MKGIPMDVKENGLYVLSDSYFQQYDTGRMMDNKAENRPHFFALQIDGILWMIPISSKVEKYRAAIARSETAGKKTLFYHLGVISGRESAFLIGDMIPVVQAYIVRPYTVSGMPYVVRDAKLLRSLKSKAKRYLTLVRQGKIRPHVDILDICRRLADMGD